MAGKKDKKSKEAEAPEAAAEGAEGEAPPKKKLAGKTLILFIVLPAVLVLGGGGAAAVMLLGGNKSEAHAEAEGEHGEEADAKDEHGKDKKDVKKKDDAHGKDKGKEGHGASGEGGDVPPDVGVLIVGEDGNPSYYEVPKILVNLAGNAEDRPLLLQLELVLESADSHTFDQVPALMPRLRDQVQTFLRELRVEDLNGSAGTYRLRLELLKRFNLVMAPQSIDAVLIEGILVQ